MIAVYWAKYNENASLIASGGQHSPVIIWDMKKGGIFKTINCKSEVTYCVEWSKDEKYLATT
jgi:WD40 repeat protein